MHYCLNPLRGHSVSPLIIHTHEVGHLNLRLFYPNKLLKITFTSLFYRKLREKFN